VAETNSDEVDVPRRMLANAVKSTKRLGAASIKVDDIVGCCW